MTNSISLFDWFWAFTLIEKNKAKITDSDFDWFLSFTLTEKNGATMTDTDLDWFWIVLIIPRAILVDLFPRIELNPILMSLYQDLLMNLLIVVSSESLWG